MLDFDTTRKPVRPRQWRAVLDGVFRASVSDEQSWLEWKFQIDWSNKSHIVELLAKHIIAFADRDPEESAATVGGIGILVLGLAPGEAPGVKLVDNADLDKWISAYVGADGPAWQAHWEAYNDKHVLIVEVIAPAWGDPIHSLQKAYDRYYAGMIFVRKRARSDLADPRDLKRLEQRLRQRLEHASALHGGGLHYLAMA